MAYFDPDYFDGTYFDAGCSYFDGSYFDPTYFCANGGSTPPSPPTGGHHAVGRTRRPLDDDELFALI